MIEQPTFQTGRLLRINLRRDWRKLLIWLIVMTGLFAAIASKFNSLYGTKADIAQITQTLKSPAMIAMFGRLPSAPFNTADVFASEMTIFMAIFGAIMNFAIAIPITRGDEESGVTELISAHQVGQLAPLAAAISELVLLNTSLALLYFGGLQVASLTGATFAGNLVLSIGLGLNGLMFGFVAVFCAQLSESSRGATALSYGIFGASYLWRMITDVTHPALTWASPLGWVEKFSTYRSNNWQPASMMFTTVVILLLLAIVLRQHRDFNSGILVSRGGRKRASVFLSGPIGLVWRLERNSIIVWVLGIAILGASYGSVFNTVADILKNNSLYAGLLGNPQALHEAATETIKAFMAIIAIVFSVIAIIPGVQIINRLVTDENRGYLEMLHAHPVSRTRLLLILTVSGLLTTTLTLAAGIFGLGSAANSVLTHPLAIHNFLDLFWANLTPTLIVLGIAAVLSAWAPRLISLTWGYVGYIFFIGYLGGLLDLPKWLNKLSPFGYIGKVPSDAINWSVFSLQLVILVGLLIIAVIGYHRRDIAAKN